MVKTDIYRIKQINEIQEILIAERERYINEMLVQNITEELILLA